MGKIPTKRLRTVVNVRRREDMREEKKEKHCKRNLRYIL